MQNLQQPLLALTIDDAPDGAGTDAYLTLLQQFSIPATFFLVGTQITQHPEQILAMQRMGCELGNHSMQHLDFTTCTATQIRQELSDAEHALRNVIPTIGMLSVRVPYFAYNETVYQTVQAPLIDAACTELDSYAHTTDALLQAKDGDVILVHSWNTDSRLALQTVLPTLLQRGFQFVTVRDLFALRHVTPQNGVLYRAVPPKRD